MNGRCVHGDVQIELWHGYKKYTVSGTALDQGAQAILMPDGTIYDLKRMGVEYDSYHHKLPRFLPARNTEESVWGKLPILKVLKAQLADEPAREMHGHDTAQQIFFYEHEFYVFSNFSSFAIYWKGKLFPTSEHAYHWEKFGDEDLKEQIRNARSAHDALKIAHANKDEYRSDWCDEVALQIMKELLRAKVNQHPYVEKKLLESHGRELIEDSWRDSFWGLGPNKDGKNWLGKLWMELRDELETSSNTKAALS